LRRREVASESEAGREMAERSIISGHGRRSDVERRSESERREMKLRIAGVAAGTGGSAVATVGLVIGMTAGTCVAAVAMATEKRRRLRIPDLEREERLSRER
jgi:hypothetical protein